MDLALLRLKKKGVEKYVMKLYNGKMDQLYIGNSLTTVGCGLGHPPIITQGIIAYPNDEIDGYPYILSTAPSIFGNSGGASLRQNPETGIYEMIGIPARISISGGFVGQAITHMGFLISIETIKKFLAESGYEYIYNTDISKDVCIKLRKQLKKKNEAKYISAYGGDVVEELDDDSIEYVV